MSESDDVTIRIPHRLCDSLQRKIIGTNFANVQDYIIALVQEAIGEDSHGDRGSGLSTKEEEDMKEKLKTLGYL